MFVQSAGCAVEALTYLAGQPPGKLSGPREIGTATGYPLYFCGILWHLGQEKLVRSFTGVGCCHELARHAEKIAVSEILLTSPDADLSKIYVLGLAQSNDEAPCPLHSCWKGVRKGNQAVLDQTTLADQSPNARKSSRRWTCTPS